MILTEQTPNYDEASIVPYELPDPLRFEEGKRVQSLADWTERRLEILHLFEDHVYGKTPGPPEVFRVSTSEVNTNALDGLAVRKQVSIFFSASDYPRLDLLIYLPASSKKPVPVFAGLNFTGNCSIHPDPAIKISEQWAMTREQGPVSEMHADESSRGIAYSRWPIESILSRGYAVATACYGDLDPDYDDHFLNGVHPLFDRLQPRLANAWGAIGAWAWGLSRILDYIAIDSDLDETKTAVIGHSRLGKAALWAGAQDERFAMVISNNSGCGGAALFRRKIGETAKLINDRFPHWFCENFKKYNSKEELLPIDQHQLIALAAPRPVYVASAAEDLWADPRGEFLASKAAAPVYDLFGPGNLDVEEMPAPGSAVISRMGYHIRSGPHDITLFDWQKYLDFADIHLKMSS